MQPTAVLMGVWTLGSPKAHACQTRQGLVTDGGLVYDLYLNSCLISGVVRQVGVDSFASVTFARALSTKLGVQVTGRDLLLHPRISELCAHLLVAVRAQAEANSTATAEMQLMQNMQPLNGLRGLVVMQVAALPCTCLSACALNNSLGVACHSS